MNKDRCVLGAASAPLDFTVDDLHMIASVLTDHADERAESDDQPDGAHDAKRLRAIARKAGMQANRALSSAPSSAPAWQPSAHWIEDCQEYRGRLLTGKHSHWCNDWDGLPIDETCPEWPCACAVDGALPDPPSSAPDDETKTLTRVDGVPSDRPLGSTASRDEAK
jgi:hypothetical protein